MSPGTNLEPAATSCRRTTQYVLVAYNTVTCGRRHLGNGHPPGLGMTKCYYSVQHNIFQGYSISQPISDRRIYSSGT